MRNEKWLCRPNKVLHLNEDKDQNVVFGSPFFSNPVFEKMRGEKG